MAVDDKTIINAVKDKATINISGMKLIIKISDAIKFYVDSIADDLRKNARKPASVSFIYPDGTLHSEPSEEFIKKIKMRAAGYL